MVGVRGWKAGVVALGLVACSAQKVLCAEQIGEGGEELWWLWYLVCVVRLVRMHRWMVIGVAAQVFGIWYAWYAWYARTGGW